MEKDYNCILCNYKSNRKGDFNRHIKTKKHLSNQVEGDLSSKIDEVEKAHKGVEKESKKDKKRTKVEKKGQKKDIKRTNEFEKGQKTDIKELKIKELNICNYCENEFSSRQTLLRHKKRYCKIKDELSTKIYLQSGIIEKLEEEMKEFKKEKEQLYKQIDALIKKAGNTTITNNLNLNSYGKEDLSHITDSFKTNLIKGPFRMIPKMIEAVHFNDKKPENKNISLTNKKENVIKVFKGGKWKYYNKNDIMEELMETNYYLLDSHYEIDHELNGVQKARYSKFQEKYDTGELSKDTKDCINLLLLNGAE